MTMIKLADVHSIPVGGSIAVPAPKGRSVGGYNLMLLRKGLEVYCYVNSCPHTGAPLDFVDGRFLSANKQHIQCSTHDALFEIDNGRCVYGPCVGQHLKPLAIEVINGEVWLL